MDCSQKSNTFIIHRLNHRLMYFLLLGSLSQAVSYKMTQGVYWPDTQPPCLVCIAA
jgi:hypothetical protein